MSPATSTAGHDRIRELEIFLRTSDDTTLLELDRGSVQELLEQIKRIKQRMSRLEAHIAAHIRD